MNKMGKDMSDDIQMENLEILNNPLWDDAILFCLFMGYEKTSSGRYSIKVGDKRKICYPKDMKFYCSWDWIMPVVERIEQSYLDDEGCVNLFQISLNSAIIKPGNWSKPFVNVIEKTKIKAVNEAAVSFIINRTSYANDGYEPEDPIKFDEKKS